MTSISPTSSTLNFGWNYEAKAQDKENILGKGCHTPTGNADGVDNCDVHNCDLPNPPIKSDEFIDIDASLIQKRDDHGVSDADSIENPDLYATIQSFVKNQNSAETLEPATIDPKSLSMYERYCPWFGTQENEAPAALRLKDDASSDESSHARLALKQDQSSLKRMVFSDDSSSSSSSLGFADEGKDNYKFNSKLKLRG